MVKKMDNLPHTPQATELGTKDHTPTDTVQDTGRCTTMRVPLLIEGNCEMDFLMGRVQSTTMERR